MLKVAPPAEARAEVLRIAEIFRGKIVDVGPKSFVIEMTGKEDLPNGIALNSAAFNAARILGPAVAGVLVATLGEAGCFWLNALSFVAVLVSLGLIRSGRRASVSAAAAGTGPGPAAAAATSTMREGLAYAWSSRSIRR